MVSFVFKSLKGSYVLTFLPLHVCQPCVDLWSAVMEATELFINSEILRMPKVQNLMSIQ